MPTSLGAAASSLLAGKGKTPLPPPPAALLGLEEEEGGGRSGGKTEGSSGKAGKESGQKRKLTTVEELMLNEKRKKERDAAEQAERKAEEEKDEALGPDEAWLCKGIIVKVVNKKLGGGKYYKKKGVVQSVDKYAAQVKVNDLGHVLSLDQEHLETVIPSAGGEVLVVAGKYKGQVGVLKSIEEEEFAARVHLEKSGERLLPYENISKLA
eukprot:CAMPEP_0181341734 /NCGR_PEP_ID=MMETSP1101-20121128/30588_1 /TAXON_ID=46948 /ORGANISM="Rhodomonas abbreviata, Strain Caron Lab Isolate" /LENGTH=209 /DNA_ID=CAMNT_0023453071 /DNA_START=38 /DNA_END=667 /DNA_ORIENTATION=+